MTKQRYDKNGKLYKSGAGVKGSSLPDVVVGAAEAPTFLVEIKFIGDRVRSGSDQIKRYREIAKTHLLEVALCPCKENKEKEEAFKKQVEAKAAEMMASWGDDAIEPVDDLDWLLPGGRIIKGGKMVKKGVEEAGEFVFKRLITP